MGKNLSKRLADSLPIVEVFTSIQGEGRYVGEPSVFIRVSGCNLRCCFKDSVCDTPYTSFKPAKATLTLMDVLKEFTDHPNVRSVVITGGEPMLYANALEDLIDFIEEEMQEKYFFTVETNGTMNCDEMSKVDMFSISPKLATSIPVPGKEYTIDGETKIFTEKEVDVLEQIRFRPGVVAQLMRVSDFQLKFVYSGDESIRSIDIFLRHLTELGAHFDPSDVMLMPEGITNEQLTKNAQEAARICIDRGWILCDRLHIRVWGNKRGV